MHDCLARRSRAADRAAAAVPATDTQTARRTGSGTAPWADTAQLEQCDN